MNTTYLLLVCVIEPVNKPLQGVMYAKLPSSHQVLFQYWPFPLGKKTRNNCRCCNCSQDKTLSCVSTNVPDWNGLQFPLLYPLADCSSRCCCKHLYVFL